MPDYKKLTDKLLGLISVSTTPNGSIDRDRLEKELKEAIKPDDCKKKVETKFQDPIWPRHDFSGARSEPDDL